MIKFQLRHGNDLLAMDSIRDCDVILMLFFIKCISAHDSRNILAVTNTQSIVPKDNFSSQPTFSTSILFTVTILSDY